MAKRVGSHELLNSFLAIVALIVSGASAYFAWQSNHARREAVAFVVRPNTTCRTEYRQFQEGGVIGLCWSVIFSNVSENRISIVNFEVFTMIDGNLASFGGFQNLEASDGSQLSLPLTLDGGEAREVVVRGPVRVPATVASAISRIPEFQNRNLTSLPINFVERELASLSLDIMGNRVEPIIFDGQIMGWSSSSPKELAAIVLIVTTGRGVTFSKRMTYPHHPD